MRKPGQKSRRSGLIVAGAACCLIAAAPASGAAATGFLELDQPAIPAKAPDQVYLDSIARAGDRLVAVGEHGVIIYSDDNAATWRQASVPVDVTLTSVAFSSAKDGWAVGNFGAVLHTTNAGASWELQLDGVRANQLTLAAAQQATSSRSTAIGAPNALRRAGIFIAQGPNKPFLAVLPLNADQVIAIGADRMAMRSDDGGATWRDTSLAFGDPFSHNLYAATRTASGIYVVGETGHVFRSTDRGGSFPAVATPAASTLFGVLAAGGRIIAYGVAGAIFRSDDGAKTWARIAAATTENLVGGIVLASGHIVLAAEGGTLLVSRDGGATFQPARLQLPMALFDITEAADGGMIAVGSRGAMKIPAAAAD